MKNTIATIALIASFAGASFAQDDGPASMADAMNTVTVQSLALQETLASLNENIERSSSSQEEGIKVLDEMLAAAEDANSALNEDSEVWEKINTLLKTWDERRQHYTQQAQENPAMQDIADKFQARVVEGRELRTQILDQASASRNLIEDIKAKRDVVLGYYELDLAEDVLSNMRQMSAQLGSINENMELMLQTAGVDPSEAALGQ